MHSRFKRLSPQQPIQLSNLCVVITDHLAQLADGLGGHTNEGPITWVAFMNTCLVGCLLCFPDPGFLLFSLLLLLVLLLLILFVILLSILLTLRLHLLSALLSIVLCVLGLGCNQLLVHEIKVSRV